MKLFIGATIIIGALIKSAPVPPQLTPINQIIERESKINSLDSSLVRAVIKVESDWKPKAVSSKGARGLMQVMPEHLAYFGYKKGDLFDEEKNIKAGARLLREELDRFGNKFDALRAYNCGSPKAKINKNCGKNYAKKVLSIYETQNTKRL
jgi:soluble lytic murein transglycosylase-like protein